MSGPAAALEPASPRGARALETTLRAYDPFEVAAISGAALSAATWPELLSPWSRDLAKQQPLGRVLAWALTTPLLMRWTCLAARLEEVVAARTPPSKALVSAEKWLREGQDPMRYQAYSEAEQEDYQTPAALAALAVFLSGPSIAPEAQPPQAPSPHLARRCAAGVLVAAASARALGEEGFLWINQIGLDLAGGGDGRSGAQAALQAARARPARA